jgi:hypothetical protein
MEKVITKITNKMLNFLNMIYHNIENGTPLPEQISSEKNG